MKRLTIHFLALLACFAISAAGAGEPDGAQKSGSLRRPRNRSDRIGHRWHRLRRCLPPLRHPADQACDNDQRLPQYAFRIDRRQPSKSRTR